LCKRDCVYNNRGVHGHIEDTHEKPCNWCLEQENLTESRTRTGTLMKRYSLPSGSIELTDMLKGDNCPFYRAKKAEVPARQKPMPATGKKKRVFQPAPEEDLLRLYGEGLSDWKISKLLNTTEDKVRRWRWHRGLEANHNTTARKHGCGRKEEELEREPDHALPEA